MLNEALVKVALNVSEHRKTPVLHSTVGAFPAGFYPSLPDSTDVATVS